MNIKTKVDKLVQFYKTRDPFEIIKGMNVLLVTFPLEGVRGFYQYFQQNNIIYLDERLNEHDKALVLAHELGHMFLHKKSNAFFLDTRTHFVINKYEIEANKFAAYLLIPDEIILENWQYTTGQLARLLGYSEELIKLRLQ